MSISNIFSGIVGSGVVLALAKIVFGQQVKRIDDVVKEQNEIKNNYLSQFREVKDLISDVRVDIARIEGFLTKDK